MGIACLSVISLIYDPGTGDDPPTVPLTSKEYTQAGDRLHIFKLAARIGDETQPKLYGV